MTADGPAGARLVDAGLAAAALSAVVVGALAADAHGRPLALSAGVVGALLVEAVLDRRHAAVRAAWARPAVKAATVVGFLAALGGALAFAPARGLSLLAGGLVGYLGLLAGSAVGGALRRTE